MNIDALLYSLKNDEGWRAHVYKDSLGFDTIGWGFLIDSRKGVGLPREVAEVWLRHAVNERLTELQRLWPKFNDQPEDVWQAIGNMAYQLGPAGVMKFKRMIAALEARDRQTAAEEALDSTWAKQTNARAQRVAAMIRGS